MTETVKHTLELRTDTTEPVYRQIAESLKKRILSGEYPAGMRLPSELELAAQWNVNRITLRKGLRILVAQNLLSQTPHRGTFVTEHLQKSVRIAIVWNNQKSENSPYRASLISSIGIAVSKRKNAEIVFVQADDLIRKKDSALIADINCDALLVPVGSSEIYDLLDEPKYDDVPIVFMNRYSALPEGGKRYAVFTEADAIEKGVEYLRKAGHRKICFLSSACDNAVIQNRNTVFRKCCPEEAQSVLCPPNTDWYEFAGEKALELFGKPDHPTAFLTVGQKFSAGLWHSLLKAGIRIPEEVSILGFDAMPDTFPEMSTIDQPVREMTESAVEILYNCCCFGKIYRNHTFGLDMVIHDRGSIRNISLSKIKSEKGGKK